MADVSRQEKPKRAARLVEVRRALRELANSPLFKSHFAWGPLNSFVLLAGSAITAAGLWARGDLPADIAVGTGVAVAFLLFGLQLGRRWDSALAGLLFVAIALALVFPDYGAVPLVTGLAVSTIVACAVQVVSHWDKAILLRLGEFRGLRGPGLFVMVPFLDRVEAFVDQRMRPTDFRAERILTLDTVPVYVDAICFWLVWNAEKAVLEVENYVDAVILSAQTALKDAVGKHELADLLSARHKLGMEIQKTLDEKTNAWGISIQPIEITDVVIPEGLEEAMSKRAQAERERQARVILSTAEAEIAEKFAAAAERYRGNPEALHLRAMNMVFEGIRQRGSMVIVPSSAVETMGLGAIPGLAALARAEEAADAAPPQGTDEEVEDDT
jgi:regulator of protease activity HflC (stomatin/prohibitin superfamily)